MKKDICYLLKMDTDKNNYRFYKMIRKDDYFLIEQGRVGATPIVSKRPLQFWEETYQKHIKEGYVDRTEYITSSADSEYRDIEDGDVREFVEFLLNSAKKIIKENYSVSYEEVSLKQVDDAETIIKKMIDSQDVAQIRKYLVQLYLIIPRKIQDIKASLPTDIKDMPNILEREIELLDIMKSQIATSRKESSIGKETVLEANGLAINLVTNATEIKQIQEHMGESSSIFSKAFRVRNKRTDSRFYDFMNNNGYSKRNIHYYYHGSRNENFWSIVTNGQSLDPKDVHITGKMFGYGLYYANKARKSIGYTSLKGSYWAKGSNDRAYLAVFKVLYKNPMHVQKHEHQMCSYTKQKIYPYDAVFAHGGIDLRNDEIIVYDERQVTLQYLVELKTKAL